MTTVSTSYLSTGRTGQKQRTRDHLIAATRRLIEDGDMPSIDDVARASGISRTTAYRYFATRDELLAAAFPETVAASMLPDPAPSDVTERVETVVAAIVELIESTEHQQRAMLRLSLEDTPHELPLRQGRAIAWLEEALEPLRSERGEDVRTLALALRSVCGIETRVWLTDVAKLSPHEVGELQQWMGAALVARATAGPFPGE